MVHLGTTQCHVNRKVILHNLTFVAVFKLKSNMPPKLILLCHLISQKIFYFQENGFHCVGSNHRLPLDYKSTHFFIFYFFISVQKSNLPHQYCWQDYVVIHHLTVFYKRLYSIGLGLCPSINYSNPTNEGSIK